MACFIGKKLIGEWSIDVVLKGCHLNKAWLECIE
jgi:hypothetical protein